MFVKEQLSGACWVMLTDMVDSKKATDRDDLAKKLNSVLRQLSKNHQGAFFAPPVQSKGIDETSSIIQDPCAIPPIILEFAIDWHPHSLRFGLACGQISPVSRIATQADGPAFHEAARQLVMAEKDRRYFKMNGSPLPDANLVQLLLHHSLSIIASWPKATALAARTKWHHPNASNDMIAEKLKISPQAVSKSLKRSRLDELLESQDVLNQWFASQSCSPLK